MNYTKQSFALQLKKRFPDNQFEIIQFSGAFKPIKYKCLKCGKIYEKTRANHLYQNKSLCQHCYSSKNSLIRNWVFNFFKDNKQFSLLSWSNNTSDLLTIKCNKCNQIFLKQPSNIYKKNIDTICPLCGKNGAPIIQQMYQKMMIENGFIDYKILDYKTITKSVKLRHQCGYVFSQKGINFLKSKGCPKCFKTKSKGEIIIQQWLQAHQINYIYQYYIKELNNCSYDFYLPDYQILIEYQGQQHYFPINYFGGQQKFNEQLIRDKAKVDYANKNNYHLIIIPYTDFNNINSYLLPILGSTTSSQNVISSEMKEKTSIDDNIV